MFRPEQAIVRAIIQEIPGITIIHTLRLKCDIIKNIINVIECLAPNCNNVVISMYLVLHDLIF
jgi:hypothetical protein